MIGDFVKQERDCWEGKEWRDLKAGNRAKRKRRCHLLPLETNGKFNFLASFAIQAPHLHPTTPTPTPTPTSVLSFLMPETALLEAHGSLPLPRLSCSSFIIAPHLIWFLPYAFEIKSSWVLFSLFSPSSTRNLYVPVNLFIIHSLLQIPRILSLPHLTNFLLHFFSHCLNSCSFLLMFLKSAWSCANFRLRSWSLVWFLPFPPLNLPAWMITFEAASWPHYIRFNL